MENRINLCLTRILTHIGQFLRNYKKKPNLVENILNTLYLHPIYKNRKKIEKFLSIIEKAELNFKEKINEIKETSDMKKKRIDELAQINNFIDYNYEKLLKEINKSEGNLLLPSQIKINEIDEIKNDDIGKKEMLLKNLEKLKSFSKKRENWSKIIKKKK